MRRHRGRLIAFAIATLSVQIAGAWLGLLRVCCPVDRTAAAGPGAAACEMHARGDMQARGTAHPASHDHHQAASVHRSTPDDSPRMTCDCTRAGHLAVGAPGVLPSPPALMTSAEVVGLSDERRLPVLERLSTPTSPPPRPPVSFVS
jgi:hypothetical protein